MHLFTSILLQHITGKYFIWFEKERAVWLQKTELTHSNIPIKSYLSFANTCAFVGVLCAARKCHCRWILNKVFIFLWGLSDQKKKWNIYNLVHNSFSVGNYQFYFHPQLECIAILLKNKNHKYSAINMKARR